MELNPKKLKTMEEHLNLSSQNILCFSERTVYRRIGESKLSKTYSEIKEIIKI